MKYIENIRAPKGFYFRVHKGHRYRKFPFYKICLYLTSNKECIGHVVLDQFSSKKYYETHATLNIEFRGQKLGALMYAKAIQWALKRNYGVKSSGDSSSDALNVWSGKSLNKFFKIKSRQVHPNDSYHTITYYAYNKKASRSAVIKHDKEMLCLTD